MCVHVVCVCVCVCVCACACEVHTSTVADSNKVEEMRVGWDARQGGYVRLQTWNVGLGIQSCAVQGRSSIYLNFRD